MGNTLKTALLLTSLTLLLMLVGQALGRQQGMMIAFVVAGVMNFVAYFYSDKIALMSSGAKPVTREELPRVYEIVERLCGKTGLPMPKIYVIPTQSPNAFATGRNPQHAAVAVTAGILDLLTDEELEGVLAHELGHVRNRDILISSVAATVAVAITFLARMAMWGAILGGGNRGGDRNGNVFGALAMMILAPIAATMLNLALSRSREFEADRSGAALLGTGEPLARALEKIDASAKQIPMNIDPAYATAYIINPLSGRKINFSHLFQTHPPTEERLARLRNQRPVR